MNELQSNIVYDNTSDLYKSLGYTLLDKSDTMSGFFVDSFSDLVNELTKAVNDPSYTNQVARCIKRVFKREYKNPKYSDTPILECVDHIMETMDSCCYLTDEQKESKKYLESCLEEAIQSGIEELCVSEDSGFNPNPYNIYNECPFDVAIRNTTRGLIKLDEAVTDEEITEAMLYFGRLNIAMEQQFCVMEGNTIAKKARSISRNANKKEAKLISKIGGTISQVKKAGKEAITPMEKFINNALEKVKKADKNERRNIIIQGGMFPKVWRWVKRGIPLIIAGTAGAVFSPAAIGAGLAFIGWIASDKYLDARERSKLLKELEDEIQIVNEKIDDSRGDDNKQKKYELMRIRNDLKRTQDKIRLGLRY